MNILSCGAGQQSTALGLMSCSNALTLKTGKGKLKFPLIPIYDAIIFCDLGGEREWVYKQVLFLKEVCETVGIPVYILTGKNLKADYMSNYGSRRVSTIPFWSIDENGKKGKMRRQCTIDYKIEQIHKFVRWNLLGYKKGQRTKPEDLAAHEMHLGFTHEEQHRSFPSKNKLFVNKYPMIEMELTRADNYQYVKEQWGLETKGSACLFCPFHSNYFFKECKETCPSDYQTVLEFDNLLENGIPNKRIGVPNSKVYISYSRKRIKDLTAEDCCDQEKETFYYKGQRIWNGF